MDHGTGWVERIVADDPDVSTYFTPLSICLNIDSFEHLEFETRIDQLIVYALVIAAFVMGFSHLRPRLGDKLVGSDFFGNFGLPPFPMQGMDPQGGYLGVNNPLPAADHSLPGSPPGQQAETWERAPSVLGARSS